MKPIPNFNEQRLVSRALVVGAKNASRSMEKFVHWILAGFAAGLIYLFGQKTAIQVVGIKTIGHLFMIAAILGIVQRYISMLIGTASRVSQEVEKLVDPNVETNLEHFLLIYINSLPQIARWPAAVAAESLLDGDLIRFSRWLFMLTMVQCLLGAGCAALVLRAAYLVMAGASAGTP
jgi:hypothetical protein